MTSSSGQFVQQYTGSKHSLAVEPDSGFISKADSTRLRGLGLAPTVYRVEHFRRKPCHSVAGLQADAAGKQQALRRRCCCSQHGP